MREKYKYYRSYFCFGKGLICLCLFEVSMTVVCTTEIQLCELSHSSSSSGLRPLVTRRRERHLRLGKDSGSNIPLIQPRFSPMISMRGHAGTPSPSKPRNLPQRQLTRLYVRGIEANIDYPTSGGKPIRARLCIAGAAGTRQ